MYTTLSNATKMNSFSITSGGMIARPDKFSDGVRCMYCLSDHPPTIAGTFFAPRFHLTVLELSSGRIQRRQQQRVGTGGSGHAEIWSHNFLKKYYQVKQSSNTIMDWLIAVILPVLTLERIPIQSPCHCRTGRHLYNHGADTYIHQLLV